MKITYDRYYLTENYFGKPYPELLEYFAEYATRGLLLDLGCGQGRDAIALARLGYDVTGIDHSRVGIEQLNRIANREQLNLRGRVGDIYEYDDLAEPDFVLLDSMFHFARRDREKEIRFIRRLLSEVKVGCLLIICIQDTGKKVGLLNKAIAEEDSVETLVDRKFKYDFVDADNEHSSTTDYRMMVLKK